MPDPYLIIIVVLVGLVGLAGRAARKKLATLERRMRSASWAISDGARVTLIGTIVARGELIASPLSARRGVIIIAQAQLPEQGPDGPVILQSRTMIPFMLETPQGPVLVDLDEADVIQPLDSLATHSKERERAFMETLGRGAEVAGVATFRELVLAPGARIAVHGVAVIDKLVNEERGYRDGVPTRTRIVRPADYPITIGPARSY